MFICVPYILRLPIDMSDKEKEREKISGYKNNTNQITWYLSHTKPLRLSYETHGISVIWLFGYSDAS